MNGENIKNRVRACERNYVVTVVTWLQCRLYLTISEWASGYDVVTMWLQSDFKLSSKELKTSETNYGQNKIPRTCKARFDEVGNVQASGV